MFEGIPSYPDAGRLSQVEGHCFLYRSYGYSGIGTERTCLYVKAYSLQSKAYAFWEQWVSQLIQSCGTGIGKERCPIVDTWWQTETGGILISALPGAIPQKPGSATLPFFGIEAVVLNPNTGEELTGAGEGGTGDQGSMARTNARCLCRS